LLDVVFVGTAEGIEDAGPGLTRHRVALIVRDLEVGDDGTVLVLALDSPEVHVYIEPYFTRSDKYSVRIRVPTRFQDFASLRGEEIPLLRAFPSHCVPQNGRKLSNPGYGRSLKERLSRPLITAFGPFSTYLREAFGETREQFRLVLPALAH